MSSSAGKDKGGMVNPLPLPRRVERMGDRVIITSVGDLKHEFRITLTSGSEQTR